MRPRAAPGMLRLREQRRQMRRARAGLRDTLLLLREFRGALLLFTAALLGAGLLYHLASVLAQDPLPSYVESVYIALTMTFLQASVDFPREGYRQAFFFLMPLVGVFILAQGLADFGTLLFNRRLRGREWEMAVASTLKNHVVLIGLGHLGYRVVCQLVDLDEDVVVIERDPRPELLQAVRALGVTLIEGDGARDDLLQGAGVARARAIMLCTQDDSENLRMALKARSLNPQIEVVIRIFDDDFAASLQSQFGFHAVSATGMAAPLFAALATDVDITPPITIEGQPHILARLKITPQSRLAERSVAELEQGYTVSIVMLSQAGATDFHPAGECAVSAGCELAILGRAENIHRMMYDNRH